MSESPYDRETLYLLDGNALAYRAHFAFIKRPLVNSKGLDTSAIFGFTNSLLQILDSKPERIAVVFDPKGKTFRDKIYEDYKAQRPPMPDPLRVAIPLIKKIVEAFDVPCVTVDGVEADDVIGTLAKEAEREGVNVIIVSADKDFRQLLSDHVNILRPAYRGDAFDLYTVDTFREKYGVEPDKFIDILALIGDKADNVPGVMGIGEVGAKKLIKEYGTVENLLDHAEDITGKKAREGLLNYKEEALMSKVLVTIKTDVELDLEWESLKTTSPKREILSDLFHEFEFRRLAERFDNMGLEKGDDAPTSSDKSEKTQASGTQLGLAIGGARRYSAGSVNYVKVLGKTELELLIQKMNKADRIAFDTETTSRTAMTAELVGCSFCWEKDTAYYVPMPMPDGTDSGETIELLRPLLTRKDVTWVGQNIKYDLKVMARHGVKLGGGLFDTMVAHYLISPDGLHGMDSLANGYLDYQMIPISKLIGTGRSKITMREVDVDDVVPYACEDVDITLQLADILSEKLKEDGLEDLAYKMEFPLLPVLLDMEMEGIELDTSKLDELSELIGKEVAEIQKEIFDEVGHEFNISSPKQLGVVLFEELGLKAKRKTATGQASTNERVLKALAQDHAIPQKVLAFRHLTKLLNTYVSTLGSQILKDTGRVHTTYNQSTAATGRLASTDPNLQNIPIRSEMGREIRGAFVAKEGCVLLSADYVQIELRILAHMSDDPGLVGAFNRREDIHASAAALINGIDISEVTKDQRNRAKEVNYGIPYGLSVYELGQRLQIDFKEAQALMDQYHESYPSVNKTIGEMVDKVRENGYAETMNGRRRYLPAINSQNHAERSAAERISVNMPIQGTQADMIKIAMIGVHTRLRKEGLKARMLLQVHDELVLEVPNEEVETVTSLVKEEMIKSMTLKVAIEVDAGTGRSWKEAH